MPKNSFMEYMMAQRAGRERLGFDQPNPPPPNVQMTGDAGVGVPQAQAAPPPQAAPTPAPQPTAQSGMAPTPTAMPTPEPMGMDMPTGMGNQSMIAASHADIADEAWEQSFFRVAGRWPTAFERQVGQTMRTTTEQTGRAPSRTELMSSVMLRVLAPPVQADEFEVAPTSQSTQPY